MELSSEQFAELADLLKRSKRFLSDAASPCQMYKPNYASLVAEIEEAMEVFGMEKD